MEISILKKICKNYNNEDVLKQLEVIEKNKDTLKIALLGRFASGKSSIVNNLFNISYMPVRDDETTSKITFIEYGEKDRAFKITDDGSIVEISLDVFSNITTSFPKDELEKISYLKLELNNDLIKGVTFIDTPGIAGLNKFTREVVYNYLPNIDFALYTVFETGFNSDDLNFLELSKNHLTHILPIINKAELVTKERDITFAFYENEWQSLFNVEKRHPLFLFSTEEDFNYKNKGNQALKSYLFNLIKDKREELKEQSFNKKITKIKQEITQDLENRKQLLELAENDKDIKNKLYKSELELSKLNLEQTELIIKINNPIRLANEKFLNNNFDENINLKKQELKDKLGLLGFNDLKKDFNRILEMSLKETGEILTSEWNSKFIQLINSIIKELGQDLDKNLDNLINSQLSKNISFTIPIKKLDFSELETLTVSHSDKKQEVYTLMSELETRLKEEKINVEELLENHKGLETELVSVQIDYQEVLTQFRNVRKLDPMYQEIINDQGNKTGKLVGKILGEAADWALIFLPGTQIKLVEPLMKVGKVVNVSQGIIDKVQKVENGMNKIKDISNDIYSRLQKNKRIKGSETFKKISNFMSNFTLSTWGERIGGAVGSLISPPTVRRVIDQNWEEDQKRQLILLEGELNNVKGQMQNAFGNKLSKEKEISQIQHEITILSEQLKKYQEMVRQIEKDEQNQRLTDGQKKENHLINLYKNVDETFSNLKRELRIMFHTSAENLSANLTEKITEEVRNQIEIIKRAIQDTNNSLEATTEDRANQIENLTKYLKSLNKLS